ncbi:UDP-N-acetylglucosamine 4,6-dehydratase (inverting) [bacterium]|nr:UDP-N-acetylglucosamine 4,6-dehydratase (inverting) [bacterium]
MSLFTNKTILITGGTGSFGQKCVETLLTEHNPKKIIVFSRDELKQYEMQVKFNNHPVLRFFIGDVRDKERLYRALEGVNYVIHAAALKQVPAIEYNPFEAVRTNVIGGYNVLTASIDKKVEKVIALSTDKAANPANLYGATKLCSDKIFISGNSLVGSQNTRFSVVRYGNVVGSRGSVIPHFLKQKPSGELTITDERMTRFVITLDQGVHFVLKSIENMAGGELFVPKIPSVKVTDIAKVIAPECKVKIIGIRPGEKLHEAMITTDDARNTLEYDDHFVIQPQFPWWNYNRLNTKSMNEKPPKQCQEGFSYTSDNNTWWLKEAEIKKMIQETSYYQETNAKK